jgi:hypothetical protein
MKNRMREICTSGTALSSQKNNFLFKICRAGGGGLPIRQPDGQRVLIHHFCLAAATQMGVPM